MAAILLKNKGRLRQTERVFGQLLHRLPSPEVLARLTTYVLVALLALSFARLTWMVLPPPQEGAVVVRQVPPAGKRPAADSAIHQLAEMHLFGQPLAQPADLINAPETTLNLTLRGIFDVEDDKALAIIASGSGNEQPYHVGDSLPGGALLHEIDVDRVILDRNGRFETLTLPKESLSTTDSGPLSLGVMSNDPAASNLPVRLGSIRNQLKQNPAELMRMNAVRPVMEDGRLKGYQLQDNPYMPIMREAGLQPGDVVTSVNGIPVTDASRTGDVINLLTNSTHVELGIQRGGTSTTRSISLRN